MIKDIFELQNPWRISGKIPLALMERSILRTVLDNLENRKMLGLIGSRQVGKSSLLYLVIDDLIRHGVNPNHLFYFNLDDLKLQDLFNDVAEFIHFLQPGHNRKYIFIDEIQRLETPGLFLKEIQDLHLNLKIIYSGSSQLEIKSKLKEHLVGRARQFEIHRLSFSEYLSYNHPITRIQALEESLIYGSYPAVSLERRGTDKKLAIKDIYQSYVEKDLVDFLKIGNVGAFNRLLVLLANQIGQLLNVDKLSKALRIPRKETEKYLSILESTFIIKRIYPFHKNYKKEITKTPKLYFMDLGLRNFVINNFNELALRNDQGDLFENFYLLELLKSDFHSLNRINFWRTTNQTEIDFIIMEENKTRAIEVKWEKSTRPKSFRTLERYYPEIETDVITRKAFVERFEGS